MRICLLSLSYPPVSTDGIPRQRQILASEMVRQGHCVHVVTLGQANRVRSEQGVSICEVAVPKTVSYSHRYPHLDPLLTRSQALNLGLLKVLEEERCDIVDIPLWEAQGFVALHNYRGPSVVWLQTSLAQIYSINEIQVSDGERAMLALDQACLERASGLLADSHAILQAVKRDYRVGESKIVGIAHLGLPPLADATLHRAASGACEALVVGRLEKRKGTPLLFDILPSLLRSYPQLVVRFVGRDNSQNDGWRLAHGCTYPEYFRNHFPGLEERVFFEDHVSEEKLESFYRKAEFLIAPSLYESFGLVYLEAMRAALPIVTFSVGAAPEIFQDGENDGALLVDPADREGLKSAISNLIEQPDRRRRLGESGLARFQVAFTAEKMVKSTLRFYRSILDRFTRFTRNPKRKIYQVMEALTLGDGVSNITRCNASFLKELDQPGVILARYAHPELSSEVGQVNKALSDPDCGLIFHFWNYSTSTWILQAVRGPKAIYYHNITPPHYFSPNSLSYQSTSQGLAQLARIVNRFDLLIGVSRYNLLDLSHYINEPKPAIYIYPVVEREAIQSLGYDEKLYHALRSGAQISIVFVGRIARNKRQDLLMHLFDYYFHHINRHARLWLIGSEEGDPVYRAELEDLRLSLRSGQNIFFTGKISEKEKNAYYRAADVFVSASEHEGFCIPIVEAMGLDIPVIAYAAAAVPETMGKAGILIHEWDEPRLAELMHLVISDKPLRQRLIKEQQANLRRFSTSEARSRMKAAVSYLQFGETNTLIEMYEPRPGLPVFVSEPIIINEEVITLPPQSTSVHVMSNQSEPQFNHLKTIPAYDFLNAYGEIPLKELFSDDRQVPLRSLDWLNIPDQPFLQFVTNRSSLPFDGVPPNENWKKNPTFFITQAHRLWITLSVIYPYLRPDSAVLDLGAFPFSLDIILRDYLKFMGTIDTTTNKKLPDDWQDILRQKDIRVTYADLDTYVQYDSGFSSVKDGLPFADGSIDFAILTHVIEHLYHPFRLLQDVQRILKPGGKFLVSTDNAYMLDAMLRFLQLNNFLHEPIEGTAAMSFHFWRGHNRFFTGGDLSTLLEKSGFSAIAVSFYEVCYNAFVDEYFKHPYKSMPKWRADILAHTPGYRNEVMVMAEKSQRK